MPFPSLPGIPDFFPAVFPKGAPKPKGAFKGALFYTRSELTTVGRHAQVESVPFENEGAIAVDMSRAPQKYRIEAILIGDDYARDMREALLKAIESPGPGLLKHPQHGNKIVQVKDDIQFGTDTTSTRVCVVHFNATEYRERPPATARLNTGGALKAAASGGLDATVSSFGNVITGLKNAINDFVEFARLDVLDDILSDLQSINGMITAVLSVPGAFAAQIDAISTQLAQLIATPDRLINAFVSAFDVLAQAVNRITDPSGFDVDREGTDETVSAMRAGLMLQRAISATAIMGAATPAVPDVDTPAREQQAHDQRVIQRHVRAAGLFSFAGVVPDVRFTSADDARAVQKVLVDALLALAESEPDLDAPVIKSLRNTAAIAGSYLAGVAGGLPDLVEYTPVDSLPASVLAYMLYGDADREDEIIARNRGTVKHPLFVPGRATLEVPRI